ncbi:hypothetical protein [Luteibacter sp. RCC_6_2]|uniref:hypothetical protein n=1 Tax=Luteibacter sp. RCC_6_2 TaxID=3239223 RepID=UPI003526B0B7
MSDLVHTDFGHKLTIPELCDRYSTFIDACVHLNYMVRSTELQRLKAEEIDSYIIGIKAVKRHAVVEQWEDVAHLMFHFQCMLRSVQSALRVWVELKEGDSVRAWSHLVDAQEYCATALLAKDHNGAQTLHGVLGRMESCLFPAFKIFNSAAYIETAGDCSICGQPFGDCDHIEGLIYWGRLCRRANVRIIEADHVSLVTHPRDRRCIITSHSNDDGRMVDVMSLEVTGDVELEPGVLMHANSIFMTATVLDFD